MRGSSYICCNENVITMESNNLSYYTIKLAKAVKGGWPDQVAKWNRLMLEELDIVADQIDG